jgi:hypothetical protein
MKKPPFGGFFIWCSGFDVRWAHTAEQSIALLVAVGTRWGHQMKKPPFWWFFLFGARDCRLDEEPGMTVVRSPK